MDHKVIGADDARTVRLYEVLFRYGIGSGETDGRLSMLEKRYGQQEYLDAMEYVQGAEFFPPG